MREQASATYINILIESLEKKVKVLDEIIEQNSVQKNLFAQDSLDEETFQANLKEKGNLIDKLNLLDDGFQDIYDRVKDVLTNNKSEYVEEILRMQDLIREITDKSMTVQVGEERNRVLAQNHFSLMKNEIRKSKMNLKVASQYYKNMSKVNYVDAQFMDRRK